MRATTREKGTGRVSTTRIKAREDPSRQDADLLNQNIFRRWQSSNFPLHPTNVLIPDSRAVPLVLAPRSVGV